MTALTVQTIVDAGTKPTAVAISASDTAPIGSGHDSFLVYKNTAGTIVTLTIVVPGNTAYGQALPDPSIVVPITTGEVWIPIRRDYDDGTGNVTITAAGTTLASCTVSVVKASW